MNEEEKRLEEIKGYRAAVGDTTDDEFNWLLSRLAEKDREIAHWKSRAEWYQKAIQDHKMMIEKNSPSWTLIDSTLYAALGDER